MKNNFRKVGLAAVILFTSAFSLSQSGVDGRYQADPIADPIEIGDVAPMADKSLVTTSDEQITLASSKGENGLLVIFSCNTCPWVEKWEDRYHTVASLALENGMSTVLLNSNEALRDGEESLDAMKERAAAKGYTFPYAVDPNASLADAFGANRTPEVFLFDSELRLIYHGAIDDNARDASAVETPFLMDAITAHAAGQTIEPNDTKSIGCTIKRKR
ncbi:MAG: redoxin family protein [Rhodothermales bacterium]|nr:redoxin family protein [Rhodothermales bacterium]